MNFSLRRSGHLRSGLRQTSDFRLEILRFHFVKVRKPHVQIDLSLRKIDVVSFRIGPIEKRGEIVSCLLHRFGIVDGILGVGNGDCVGNVRRAGIQDRDDGIHGSETETGTNVIDTDIA